MITIDGGVGPLATPLTPDLPKHNTVRSDYALVGPPPASGVGRLLVLVGRQYEGDPSWVQIAGLRDGRVDAGDPLRLNLVDVAWTTNGATLIGLRAWRQSAAPCRVTYDPYAVFDAAVNGSSPRVRYSEAKSRAYNLAHYVWAGPDARADITVDTCGPRPRLVRQPAP